MLRTSHQASYSLPTVLASLLYGRDGLSSSLTIVVTAATATARKTAICRHVPDVNEVGTVKARAAAVGATCPHKPIVGVDAACAATADVLGAAAAVR
eukprot:9354-Heterococcus_DN1.PRE.2